MYQPFVIADFQRGLFNGKKPWMSPADAFRVLENARAARGDLVKRSGFRHFGTLGHLVEDEDLGTAIAGTQLFGHNPGPQAGLPIAVNNLAALGSLPVLPPAPDLDDYSLVIEAPPFHFRADVIADPAFPSIRTLVSFGVPLATAGYVARVDLATGFWFVLLAGGDDLDGDPVLATYEFRAGLPVTGIKQFRDTSGEMQCLVTDTKRAFKWDTTTLRFVDVAGADTFTGDPEDLMHMEVAKGTVMLNNRVDTPYLYDPVGGLRQQDTDLTVVGGPDHDVQSAYGALYFKSRVIFIRPTEGGVPLARAFRWGLVDSLERFEGQDIAELPTEAHIVQGRVIGEQCILFCDKPGEVFELVPGDDALAPFFPRRLRGDGDAGSRMGGAQFLDEAVIWGTRRILSCDGAQCGRVFTEEVPDVVSDESNLVRPDNTIGVNADAYEEVWLGYTPAEEQYPTRIVAVNVRTQAVAKFSYPAHCFGEYLNPPGAVLTWDTDLPWGDFAWGDEAQTAGFPLILIGDRNGRVFASVSSAFADDSVDTNEVVTQVPFDTTLETEGLNPYARPDGNDFSQARLGRVDLVFESNPGAKVIVEIGSTFGQQAEIQRELDLSPENPNDSLVTRTVTVNMTCGAPFLRLRDTSDRRFAFCGAALWMARGGPMRAFR